MDKSITVRLDKVYGEVKIYPVCEAAETFAAIAGTKTLTEATVRHIKALGYTVQVQQQAVTL